MEVIGRSAVCFYLALPAMKTSSNALVSTIYSNNYLMAYLTLTCMKPLNTLTTGHTQKASLMMVGGRVEQSSES